MKDSVREIQMTNSPRKSIIVEWQPKSAYGFALDGERRIFLHISNFTQRARWPEVGDRVTFVMGEDESGRPCAREIVLQESGSLLRWHHLLSLVLLLILPGLSLIGLSGLLSPWWVLYFATFTSVAVGMQLWFDKRSAVADGSRVPEATLHLFELMGGWPGSFIAQRALRHKIFKKSYQWIFWPIVAIHQLFALDMLFGGFLYNGLLHLGR